MKTSLLTDPQYLPSSKEIGTQFWSLMLMLAWCKQIKENPISNIILIQDKIQAEKL